MAVKVVEHNAQTGSMLSTLRESALSQSISHPNVVRTPWCAVERLDVQVVACLCSGDAAGNGMPGPHTSMISCGSHASMPTLACFYHS